MSLSTDQQTLCPLFGSGHELCTSLDYPSDLRIKFTCEPGVFGLILIQLSQRYLLSMQCIECTIVHRMPCSSNILPSVCPVLSWDTVCSSPSDIISRWATGIVTLKIHASIRIPNTKLSIRHCPSPSSQSGTAHHQAFNLALPNIKIWIRLRPILG